MSLGPRPSWLLLAGALAWACGGGGGLEGVPEGEWGGQGVALSAHATGSDVQFDCARGAITVPLRLEREGAFQAAGYYVQEHGGPSREGETEDRSLEAMTARAWMILGATVLAGALGTADASRQERAPEGPWGGNHAALKVDTGGADVELDCAHGRIEEPLALDKDGVFHARGYWVREGGPQPETEDRRPASYSGTTDGHTLTLRVEVKDPKREHGPFTLVHGQPAHLIKCD